MSNKNLLNEAQIRQMMKLAKLEPLTPGFVNGLTEGDDELEEAVDGEEELEESAGAEEELEERRQTRPPGGGPGGGGTSHGRSSEPMPGDSALMREDDDELEAELHATEDELGAEDHMADEEEGEIEDLEGADAGGDKMISVSDLLAALEAAIEDVTGEEVETSMDADLEPEEVDVDVEDDFAPEGDDVVADEELELQEGDEEELEEDKDYTAKKEKPGADLRKGAEKRGAEGTLAKTKGHGRVDYANESAEATDDLVEQITKRVAARILKSALSKK